MSGEQSTNLNYLCDRIDQLERSTCALWEIVEKYTREHHEMRSQAGFNIAMGAMVPPVVYHSRHRWLNICQHCGYKCQYIEGMLGVY